MVAVLCLAACCTVHADDSLRTVALSGESAPGIDGSVNWSLFPDAPILNDRGETAFHAILEGDDVSAENNLAIFNESGGLSKVIREQDPAPWVGPGVNVLLRKHKCRERSLRWKPDAQARGNAGWNDQRTLHTNRSSWWWIPRRLRNDRTPSLARQASIEWQQERNRSPV